ncbi:GNAT family N-acetyltransferase [Glutamicibacter sp.]|uniref:GNAT family N-acetyltransferase n=1 Tax=Glutamicibacter sp. TaxID=1931995 RepID=UPI0028BEB47F|nr:GNAT family N-acetyltransferase [Glutamicibacter sp.]
MTQTAEYLDLYDQQLRTDAETPSALHVETLSTLRLVTFSGGQGFITYPHFDGTEATPLVALVGPALEYFKAQPQITSVEFKTRGHDVAPGLDEQLKAHGFTAQEPESIMIGPMESLVSSAPLPEGVELRKISSPGDVVAMSSMLFDAFEEPYDPRIAQSLSARLATNDGMELWVASLDGRMVGAGRLEPVRGTEFAGLWGGAVLKEFRGQGIYRALTSARARSALDSGYRYVHSDSTEYSRPILERNGMLKVSTTTPYEWTRP